MKKITFALALFLSFSAFASHTREYKTNEMDLANNLLRLCPQEMVELIDAYSRVTKAWNMGGQTMTGASNFWTVEVTTILPAPSFRKSIRTLKIKQIQTYLKNPPMDHRGYDETVDCTIEE